MTDLMLMDGLHKSIEFRPLREVDEQMILEWRNSEAVATHMYTDHLISSTEHHDWFELAIKENPRFLHRLICLDGEPIGLVSITSINSELRSCEWAFYIASENARGLGIGQITEWWAIEYAFNVLSLNRIQCEVLVSNGNVIQMHESFGFRRESYLRERCWKSGTPFDAIGLSLLKSDWQILRIAIAQKPRIASFIEQGLQSF